MKKIILSFILAGALFAPAIAQTDQQRTIPTRIADLLAKTPADDSAQLIYNAKEVAALGADGLVEMVKQLNQVGNKSRLHYAISGFSFYATQQGREEWRSMATTGYGKSLSQLTDPVDQQFIITQLEMVGKNDAIPYLQGLLRNDRLVDAVSRSLAIIGTPEALQTIHSAMGAATGASRLAHVKALGYAAYQPAAPAITQLLSSNPADTVLQKAGYYALASIGDKASESLLANAARKEGFRFTYNGATAAYLHWLGKQPDGNTTTKKLSGLLVSLQQPEQLATRIAVLEMLTKKYPAGAQQVLLNALKDKNIAYRQAALRFAQPGITAANASSWLKPLPTLAPAAKAELVNALADKGIASAASPALQLLQSKDASLRGSVMNAAVKLAPEKALPVLGKLLQTADATEANAIRNALLLADGKAAVETATAAMATASPAGKAAIITVLGERAVSEQVPTVLPLLNNESAELKDAAATALPKMVVADQLPQLFPLLAATASGNELARRQDIVTSALKGIADPNQQASQLLAAYRSAGAEQQSNYYRVMAAIGTPSLLEELSGGFDKASPAAQQAMIQAMANWKEGAALETLFNLSKKELSPALMNAVIGSFTRQLSNSKVADESKYSMIRELMPKATSVPMQAGLLRALGNIPTYPSLYYTAEFLDNASLKNAAASSVMNIALANNQLKGERVHALLEKSMGTISGDESEYLKAAVRKHMATLPKEDDIVKPFVLPETEKQEGFKVLFDGSNLDEWIGNKTAYVVEDGKLAVYPKKGGDGNLFTKDQYSDFIYRFEFKLTPGANNGVGIRAPLEGDAAYEGMEVQILDNDAEIYRNLQPYQYHGSVYGVMTAKKGHLKPMGEWNEEEISLIGNKIKVTLNGTVILEGDLAEASANGTLDHRDHPGLKRKAGHIGFLGHGDTLYFRNIRIKDLSVKEEESSKKKKKKKKK